MQRKGRLLGLVVVAVAAVFAAIGAYVTPVSADGPQVQAASTFTPNVQIRSTFTPGPGGGRLKIVVKNSGPGTLEYVAVSTDGWLPSQLRMAGPNAVLTSSSCDGALAPGDTSCTLDGAPNPLPAFFWFLNHTLRVDTEQMLVTAESSGVITLVRGINGTTAASHAAGAPIYLMRPQITASGGATGPACALGVALTIGCQVITLPPGGKMTILADLQVDPATAEGTKLRINLMMAWYPSDQITPITGRVVLKVYKHNLVATRLWQYP
jgi:hypothetical protein